MRNCTTAAVVAVVLAGLTKAAPAPDDDQAKAEAIVDKAIKAVGGSDNLTKLRSFKIKAERTTKIGGKDVVMKVEQLYDHPDRRRIWEQITGEDKPNYLEIISADKGWAFVVARGGDLRPEAVKRCKETFFVEAISRQLPLFKGPPWKLTPLGESKLGDRRTVGIKLSRENSPDAKLFFAVESGLPVKSEFVLRPESLVGYPEISKDTENKLTSTRTSFYEEFKEFSGVKLPTRIRHLNDDKEVGELKLIEVTVIDKFDDEAFKFDEKALSKPK
jgi:hypothetical protein